MNSEGRRRALHLHRKRQLQIAKLFAASLCSNRLQGGSKRRLRRDELLEASCVCGAALKPPRQQPGKGNCAGSERAPLWPARGARLGAGTGEATWGPRGPRQRNGEDRDHGSKHCDGRNGHWSSPLQDYFHILTPDPIHVDLDQTPTRPGLLNLNIQRAVRDCRCGKRRWREGGA